MCFNTPIFLFNASHYNYLIINGLNPIKTFLQNQKLTNTFLTLR
jgi:hypothetical protein